MDGILSMPDDGVVENPLIAARTAAAQVGQGMQGVGQNFMQFAQKNPDALIAMAGGAGMAPVGHTMGGMFQALGQHFDTQDKLQQAKDLQTATLDMKKQQLSEQQRLNTAKIAGLTAKAVKDGMPKKIGGFGGQTTLMYPNGDIESVADEDVQRVFDQAETAKTQRAALMATTKAQTDLLTNPKQLDKDAALQQSYDGAKDAFQEFQDTKAMFDSTGGLKWWSRTVPGAKWFNQKFGTQDGVMEQKLSALNLTGFISYVKGFPGALSDKEGARIGAAIPPADAGPDLWAQFFEKEGPKLQEAMTRAQKYMDERTSNKAKIMQQPSALNGGVQMPGQAPAQPPAAPAQVAPEAPLPTPPALQQKYPPGFNPPSSGLVANTEKVKVVQQDLASELQKPDGSPNKQKNVEALRAELVKLGFNPAAAAPGKPAASGDTPRLSAADAKAAISSGKLKAGDFFYDINGVKRQVH
jgi:hypothetical protein